MLKLITVWDLEEQHIIIIIIKNHGGKISVEFQESVNLGKIVLHKTLVTVGSHLEYPQNVSEKALGTSSVQAGAKFDALFLKEFLPNNFRQAFVQSLSFPVWRNRGKKSSF